MQRKYWLTIVVIIAAWLLIGRTHAIPQQPVAIVDFAFQPSSAAEEINSPITWVNQGTVAHTVTFDTAGVDSGSIAPGQTFSVSLPTVGHYTYHCSIHPSMTGAIDAQEQQLPPKLRPHAWLPMIIGNQE
jgi:hypothetical protein